MPQTQPPAVGVEHAAEADSVEQEAELRRQLAAAAAGTFAAGALLGLPELPDGDVWLDIAGAVVVSRLRPKTITSYLSRRGPKTNPFPPARRYLYRLYWPLSEIQAWRGAQDAAEAENT